MPNSHCTRPGAANELQYAMEEDRGGEARKEEARKEEARKEEARKEGGGGY